MHFFHFPITYSISRNYRAEQPAAGDGIKTMNVNLILKNLQKSAHFLTIISKQLIIYKFAVAAEKLPTN